jgi:hypothetical protein
MKSFEEVALFEDLRKLGRADDYRKSAGIGQDKRDDLIKDIHDKDIKATKDSLADHTVGIVNGITVYKSVHSGEIRDGDGSPRDYGVDNEFLLTVFRKLFLRPTYNPKKKTMVAYRNAKKKFDLMVISPLENKSVTIITMIQGNESSAQNYFGPSHVQDQKAMVESIGVIEDFYIIY